MEVRMPVGALARQRAVRLQTRDDARRARPLGDRAHDLPVR